MQGQAAGRTTDRRLECGFQHLVRFGCKNDSRTPRAITLSDPPVGFQDLEVFHNNLALVRPITWLLAADGRGAASIDRKFKMKNRLLHAGFVEAIPVIFDNADNGSFDGSQR
jgi:hypothetical protein